jgi:hypothetical protein
MDDCPPRKAARDTASPHSLRHLLLLSLILKMQLSLPVLYMAAIAAGQLCKTGTLLCCESVQRVNDPAVAQLAGQLGIVLPPTGQVGLTCAFQRNDKARQKILTEYYAGNPISVIGVGGNSCSAQPVCCTGYNFVRSN